MDTKLSKVVQLAQAQPGVVGITIISQRPGGDFLAACVNRGGHLCDPRNWDTHATAEDALDDLALKLAQMAPAAR